MAEQQEEKKSKVTEKNENANVAEKSEQKVNQEKARTKKVATGTTKKAVQKRSSSVAGKKQNNAKTAKKETTAPKKTSKKQEESVKKTAKKTTGKKETEVAKEKNQLPQKEENKKQETKKSATEELAQNKKQKKEKKAEETVVAKEKRKEIENTVAKEIKLNKIIPQTEQNKINKRIFEEVCFAIIIMFYLNFIILGFINIETTVFLTDLKVFGIAILLLAIGIFEYAYKKDSGRYCAHGIEMLILAFATMGLLYVQLMLEAKFIYIAAFITFLFAIYYIAKSIIIYQKMKKQYAIENMKEMIKK